MQRILLPLSIVAALYFGPLFAETTSGSVTGTTENVFSGSFFLDNMVGCLTELRVPIGEGCGFEGSFNDSPMVGHVINYAALLALAAGVLGVIGLLPVIGRLTSIVTLLAGLAALAAMGLLSLTLMGTDSGLGAIRWGVYLTAGLGLLTLIAGLAGLRGND
ncbi:MAG: hypothetical protein AAFW81_12100 [Pseudomonadota bacterium]